jgi:acyl carrier protein
MKDLFLQRFAEVIEKEEVKFEDDFMSYEEWDSLALLAVLSMIDDEYHVNINVNQFEKMKTIKDIYDFIIDQPSK